MARIEPPLAFDLVEEAGDWRGIDAAGMLPGIAEAICRNVSDAVGVAVLVLADDKLVQDLNQRFRGIHKPTNVLSFPGGNPPDRNAQLGDVIFASQTLLREAREENKPVGDHFAHLAVHGLLHLLGYDHQNNEEAAEMERLEARILAELAVPDPYAAEMIADPNI